MTDPSIGERHYDVDALRALAVLLLVVFHTARLFDTEPWHIKDLNAPYWSADLVVRLLNVWQMPLLFLLAGMSAAWALAKRSRSHFLVERVQRLLIPLLIGMVVFVLPQVWVERTSPEVPLRMSPIDFDGGLLAFAGPYFHCCYPAANLSWHHLWFLPYLFVYSLLLLPLARTNGAPRAAEWFAAATWRLALPGLALMCLELALRRSFPSTHDLVWDWANHAHYALLVVLGWWIARNPVLQAATSQALVATTSAAVALTGLWLATSAVAQGGLGWIEAPWAARLALRIAAEWATLLALLGLARRWLREPLPGLRAFAPLALGFYIVHQTLIVLLGWLLLSWTSDPVTKAFVIAVIAGVGSVAAAWLAMHSAPTRLALGLRRVTSQKGHQRQTVAST